MPRRRMSTRKWLIAVALTAAVLGLYITMVDRPAKLCRYRRSDQLVNLQIELLGRAATAQQSREREENEAAARCLERAESEVKAGARSNVPDGRSIQTARSALWAKAAAAHRNAARQASEYARSYRKTATSLISGRSQTAGDLAPLEKMAQAADKWLSSRAWFAEMPFSLRGVATAAYVEQKARDGLRASFPTFAGRRRSAIEATAIWEAEQSIKRSQPGVSLKGHQVVATQSSPESPFLWNVKLIDPKSGQSYEVRESFSDSTVRDYLAQNP